MDTIDGKTPGEIRQERAQYDALVAQDNKTGRQYRGEPFHPRRHASLAHVDWMERAYALDLAQEVNRLELYRDNRQL